MSAADDAETRAILDDLERLMGALSGNVSALQAILNEPEVTGDGIPA